MRLLALGAFLVGTLSTTVVGQRYNILKTFPGQAVLPKLIQAEIAFEGKYQLLNTTKGGTGTLNAKNIQGDILVGMKKQKELFVFFAINKPDSFKNKLKTSLLPYITTTAQLLNPLYNPPAMVNVAFTQSGLTKLGVQGNIGDQPFQGGQFIDLKALGDPSSNDWIPAFKGTRVHGVFLIASDVWANVNTQKATIDTILSTDYTVLYTLQGEARPGAEAGHEHFGYLDGVAQPAIIQFTTNPVPGQTFINAGSIILGQTGDTIPRPSWAIDGSFLAFRQLQQKVPEWNKFLLDNRIVDPSLTAQEGADLLGARAMGRWKSGAPIDLAPFERDPQARGRPRPQQQLRL
nr:dye decolorizing peroxidase [uncultured fungus]